MSNEITPYTHKELLVMSERRFKKLQRQTDEINELLLKTQLDNIKLAIELSNLRVHKNEAS